MIRKILKRFFTDSFSVEWRKHNSHNFTTPANHFKADAVVIGKGTYGSLNVVTRDYQNVKLIIGNYCSIADGVKFLLSGNHQYDIVSTYPYELLMLGRKDAGIAVAKGNIIIGDDVWIGANAIICSGGYGWPGRNSCSRGGSDKRRWNHTLLWEETLHE